MNAHHESFTSRLGQERSRLGLARPGMAARLGMSVEEYEGLKSGEVGAIYPDTLILLSMLTGRSIDYLVTGNEFSPSDATAPPESGT